MPEKRVVVTGLGALTPIGNNVSEFWNNLVNGESGADKITRFDASSFKTQFACEIKNFEPTNYLDRKEARKLDFYSIYALVAADEAVTDSKIDVSKINLDRSGVIWASGIGGLDTFLKECGDYAKNPERHRFNPFFIPKMIADIAAGHISIKYGFRGPNYATVSACASSTHAMIDAFNYIRWGKADLFITGGSEASINAAGVGGFNAMHALSTRNEDPKKASRPFDKDRDGFVLGEGAGALVFEEYEHAKNRGAKIYAEVVGGAMTADAYHITAPHPDGLGAKNVMRLTIEDAKSTPDSVDYINVHGTSTPLGDVAEIKAIKHVFGSNTKKLNISATKSMTGHLLGAAGAVEGIASILTVKNNIIPPTINQFNLDPSLDPSLNYTFGKSQKKTVRSAISNTFGFGGHNACIMVKKHSVD